MLFKNLASGSMILTMLLKNDNSDFADREEIFLYTLIIAVCSLLITFKKYIVSLRIIFKMQRVL